MNAPILIEEPELEFGVGRHIDVRFGIMNRGAWGRGRPESPTSISLGVVGTTQSIEGILAWLGKCQAGIDAKPSKQPNLFPRFPGFGDESCFGCGIACDSRWQRAVRSSDIEQLASRRSADELVEAAVALFLEEIRWLKENTPVKAIVCAVPYRMLELMDRPADSPSPNEDEDTPEVGSLHLDFRHLLKAKAMPLDRSVQLVLPSTYGQKMPKKSSARRDSQIDRALQDEATRAWNFHTALYYKGGGTPWRLTRDPNEFQTCYIGITFYRTLNARSVASSLAQVFNERGDGIIVRGGEARLDEEDRTPHLSRDQIQDVVSKAMLRYKKEHGHLPARLVAHKSSWFDNGERDGCLAAIRSVGVDQVDLLSVSRSLTRLYRLGVYPPIRGTFLSLDAKHHLLYSRGSVQFFETYPGMYTPRPLQLRLEYGDQTPTHLAKEVLGLTKMNWNNTQFDNSMPITLAAARQVGNVVKYIPDDAEINPHYSFYM